jgi:hypothetical protein
MESPCVTVSIATDYLYCKILTSINEDRYGATTTFPVVPIVEELCTKYIEESHGTSTYFYNVW